MSAIEILGNGPLSGEIEVQGSKNAVLPMMAAAVLGNGITVIENVPKIQDVCCMMGILNSLGCVCSLKENRLTVDSSGASGTCIRKEDMEKMRSSVILLAPLLARQGEACIYYPGGCMIGKRPIDLHLFALGRFGAEIMEDRETGRVKAKVSGRSACLKGAFVEFPYPSVGATENAIFAAVAADGESFLSGCAREPEITALCHMLNRMGARILGVGTSHLRISGGLPLHGCTVRADGDRIVAGTYLMAAAASMGEIQINGIHSEELKGVTELLKEAGAFIYTEKDRIFLRSPRPLGQMRTVTGPYPAFPTDLQSPLMTLLCVSKGGEIRETVFESRFKTAGELNKMGASIRLEGDRAFVRGGRRLFGCRVKACDLRGGAALVTAGLTASGITVVEDAEYIKRGYENICRDLSQLGGRLRYMERDITAPGRKEQPSKEDREAK